MEEFKFSEKVVEKIDKYNNSIDNFIAVLSSLKINNPDVRDIQDKRQRLHESFFKSKNVKIEKLLKELYDEYTEELADYVEKFKYFKS